MGEIPINVKAEKQTKDESKMKTNIVLLIVLVSVICLSFVGSARGDSTTLSINPSSSTLPQSNIGANYQVNITISSVANLWSWVARLNWNQSVLNFTKIDEGQFLRSTGQSTFFAPPIAHDGYLTGISDTIYVSTQSVSGSGTLATVTFHVLAAGKTDITLNETDMWGPLSGGQHPHIIYTVMNGEVIVVPEFPGWVPLAVVFATAIPLALLLKRRRSARPQTNEGSNLLHLSTYPLMQTNITARK